MSPSLRRVRARSGAGVAALAVTAALVAAVGAPTAGAQVPPPPPPGELPPTPTEPPPVPTEQPPPGEQAPPAEQTPPVTDPQVPTPVTGGGAEAPDPSLGAFTKPPALKPPRKVVELAQASAALNGRRLSVPVRCRTSGSALLRRGQRTIARGAFRCKDYQARVTFTVRSREAKTLRRAGRAKLVVRFKAGGKTANLRLTVTGRRGAGPSQLHVASAQPPWRQGADMYCGSPSGYPQGLNLSPGYMTAYDGRDDRITYIYAFYVYGQRNPLWSGWANPTLAPGVGAIWNIGHDNFGSRNAWVAVGVWKYWYRVNRYDFFWLVPRTDAFGNQVSGYYCWWGA